MRRERLVTVCDKCFRSCCWLGIFMCDGSVTAGTTQLTVTELAKLKREHRDYYSIPFLREHTGSDPKYKVTR